MTADVPDPEGGLLPGQTNAPPSDRPPPYNATPASRGRAPNGRKSPPSTASSEAIPHRERLTENENSLVGSAYDETCRL